MIETTLLAAEPLSIGATVAIVGTVLLSMLGFFLTAFYKKVEQIADDVHEMQLMSVRREEEMKAMLHRLERIEKHLKIEN